MSERQHHVLLVDDDELTCRALSREFSARGWRVTSARNRREAAERLRRGRFDLVVIDLHLGQESGLDLLSLLDGRQRPPVVVVSGYGSIPVAVDAVRLGATTFVMKPVTATAILAALDLPVGAAAGVPTLPTLEQTEWEHLQRALRDTGGNVSEAARRLGIPRRTLQRKLLKPPSRGDG